ncbi:MAG TPA: SDR family oxidoreductase [Candidatus Saccharimonadales bacterium]|nr:SDR family oxidoreductase [Candidatus Saccharimonadales bacterium]
MRILVLGAGGMAGHVIATHLSEQGHEVTTLSASKKLNEATILLDLTERQLVDAFFEGKQFDIVINAVGILVGLSEKRKDLASYLNGYLPHYLEQRLSATNTRLIHLSTDCVFSGKSAPYKEDSFRDGDTFYDRSKALGEVINGKDLTFRMSIIGPDLAEDGEGLFNWFYKQTGAVKGFTGSVWNGITTIELARGINAAIEQNLTGLYHLVSQKSVTKFELLNIIKEAFDRDDISLEPIEGVSHDKTLLNTRADFDFTVKEYPEMLKDMRDWIGAHPVLYKHYER